MTDRNRQLGASTTAPTIAPPCTKCRGFQVSALARGKWQRGTCPACGGAGTAEAQQARSAAQAACATDGDFGLVGVKVIGRVVAHVVEPDPDYKIRVNGVPWLTMGSPPVVNHMKARAIVTDELAVFRPHAPKQPEPAEAAGEVMPLWECEASGDWSRGPLNDTDAWVCETTFAYHSGRALAPMGPARQTLEEAMRDADEAAVRAGHRLPADSMVLRPELADEVRGTVWQWRPGEGTYLIDIKVSWSLDATWEVIRALKQVMPCEQAADALARILRVHGADVREVGP